MAAPTVSTSWANSGAALKSNPIASRETLGWQTLPDNLPEQTGERPNLQEQNFWQNAVHQWIVYLTSTIDAGVTRNIAAITFAFDPSDVAVATDEITEVAHGLRTGDVIQLTTSGTLPAGLALTTDYWAMELTDDTFQLASSLSNAVAGTQITITDQGTGTHTLTSENIWNILNDDGIGKIYVTTGSVTHIVNYPAVATNADRVFVHVKTDGGSGKITVQGDANINGAGSVDLIAQFDSLQTVGDGIQWYILVGSEFSDPMTTRGDVIYRNAGNTTDRLALGAVGELFTSDGSDLLWSPNIGGTGALGLPVGDTSERPSGADGKIRYNSDEATFEGFSDGAWGAIGGAGSTGGVFIKNYILNPDATDDATTGVDATTGDGSGTFTVTQTTTGSELPEEYKETAFKVLGDASIADGNFIAWDIETTNIADADSGPAKIEVRVKDIGGISGDWRFQLWSVTDSVYVGNTLTVTGDGTYLLGANIVAGDDYQFHAIATGASPAAMGLSGITLSPTPLLLTSQDGAWTNVTSLLTLSAGFAATASTKIFRKIDGTDYLYRGVIDCGTIQAADAYIDLDHDVAFADLPNAGSDSTIYTIADMAQRQVVGVKWEGGIGTRFMWAVDSDTPNRIYFRDQPIADDNFGGPQNTGDMIANGDGVIIEVRVPADILASNVAIPISDLRKTTKWLDATDASLTNISSGVTNGWSDDGSWVRAYNDSEDNWFLDIRFSGNKTSNNTGVTWTLAGVTFETTTGSNPVLYGYRSTNSGYTSGSNTVFLGSLDASTNAGQIAGSQLALASKPTWVNGSNLENAISVAAFLPDESQATTTAQQIAPNYAAGAWSPVYDSDVNMTGTAVFVNPTFTRIGKKVFVEIDSITGLTTTNIDANTNLVFTSAGLPDIVNATQFGGSSTWFLATGSRYITGGVFGNSGGDTKIFMGIDSGNSGGGTGATTIFGVRFNYTIA